MRSIDEEFLRHSVLGTHRMRDYLRRSVHHVNRKRLQRLMRQMGLALLLPKLNTSIENKKHKVYPYLLRHLVIDKPIQAWCNDITYISLNAGFVYLVSVMNCHSRKVLS